MRRSKKGKSCKKSSPRTCWEKGMKRNNQRHHLEEGPALGRSSSGSKAFPYLMVAITLSNDVGKIKNRANSLAT